jgi:hypothetical protein
MFWNGTFGVDLLVSQGFCLLVGGPGVLKRRGFSMTLLKFWRSLFVGIMMAFSLTIVLPVASVFTPAYAGSIYDAGYERKIKMTAKQRRQVRRISRAANARINRIFRKYGIKKSATPEMSKLMDASAELQASERQERNELAEVFTPKQMQQYDRIMKETENRILGAAK